MQLVKSLISLIAILGLCEPLAAYRVSLAHPLPCQEICAQPWSSQCQTMLDTSPKIDLLFKDYSKERILFAGGSYGAFRYEASYYQDQRQLFVSAFSKTTDGPFTFNIDFGDNAGIGNYVLTPKYDECVINVPTDGFLKRMTGLYTPKVPYTVSASIYNVSSKVLTMVIRCSRSEERHSKSFKAVQASFVFPSKIKHSPHQLPSNARFSIQPIQPPSVSLSCRPRMSLLRSILRCPYNATPIMLARQRERSGLKDLPHSFTII
jgi:hypothetical protein